MDRFISLMLTLVECTNFQILQTPEVQYTLAVVKAFKVTVMWNIYVLYICLQFKPQRVWNFISAFVT
jgi:hypothetical protein